MRKIDNIFTLIFVMFSLFIFDSCEKNITVDVPESEEKVVVEGSIDLNGYAMVFLTKNLPYFGVIDSTMIYNLIIQDATVVVSDGIINDTLQKTFNMNYFPPIYYIGNKIKGEVGKRYFLTINAMGKTFTSETTILPPPILIDSVWFKVEQNQDSLGYVWSIFNDPPEPGNFYRLFTKRISKDSVFCPIFFSIYDDKYFNGQQFQFSMMRGASSLGLSEEDPEFGFYKIGDTVIVKYCSVDKPSYDFWRTAEGEMYSSGNPFMTPSQIVTNIVGGGLGVWTGYGVFTDTVICKY
ncbi:MAG TPA: DUF4249 domain-containing protein [Bacteroidales bacterium]|nr:DUF4249 domain-containing protein [Bacteroidales bacterium]